MGTKKRPDSRTAKEIKRLADRVLADALACAKEEAKETSGIVIG